MRLLIYFGGVVSVSLGIVFCKKCGLGISPISSIPFVLEDILPLSFGMLTMLFHFVNTALQLILRKKLLDIKILLQTVLAMLFGFIIDFFNELVNVNTSVLAWQVIALGLSILFTAFGMLLMLHADLIQNPPDGTVKTISKITGRKIGTVKIIYDWTCVGISVAIGFIFLHKLKGFGVATVASAFLVGRTLTWMQAAFMRIGLTGK